MSYRNLKTPDSPRFFDENSSNSDAENSLKRGCFDRDRDRIIHSMSFRRLAHKTQVIFDAKDDHVRTRLTHTIEVSQIARSIARYFALSEPLTEAIALAHDLGHAPFGHVGEKALKKISAGDDSVFTFFHNDHTLKVLTELEYPYKIYRINGLNLTKACIGSIALHNGPLPKQKLTEELPSFCAWLRLKKCDPSLLHLDSYGGLEAQIAAIADDIAYLSHDLDDALRLGIVDLNNALAENEILQDIWQTIEKEGQLTTKDEMAKPTLIRHLIAKMVRDVICQTEKNIKNKHIKSYQDVIACKACLVEHEKDEEKKLLKEYLHGNFWKSEQMEKRSRLFEALIAVLYKMLRTDAYDQVKHGNYFTRSENREQNIIDYIAGMTDRFALDTCKKLEKEYPCKDLRQVLEEISALEAH